MCKETTRVLYFLSQIGIADQENNETQVALCQCMIRGGCRSTSQYIKRKIILCEDSRPVLIFIFNNRNILSFRHIIEIFCALNYCTFRFSAKYMRYFTYKNVTISKGCNNVTLNIQNAHY